jgi:hypothetical protein
MNYRHLSLRCQCGEVPDRIAEIGFTDDHNLVIHWWCSKCQKVVYVMKPLTDCWRECPSPRLTQDSALPSAKPACFDDRDVEFLRCMGVLAEAPAAYSPRK